MGSASGRFPPAPSTSPEPPVAVFTMRPEESAPVSAVVVMPSANGEEPTVLDLRQPEHVYTVPVGDSTNDHS